MLSGNRKNYEINIKSIFYVILYVLDVMVNIPRRLMENLSKVCIQRIRFFLMIEIRSEFIISVNVLVLARLALSY
jgi:hypothetical protein